MKRDAEWIWLDPVRYPEYAASNPTVFCAPAPYVVARFEKRFFAEGGSARAEIAADVRYILRLNGKIVARGPAAVGGDYGNREPLGWCFADRPAFDLETGENTLTAEVQSVPEVMADYSSGRPGFRMRLEFGGGEIVTDESWTAVPARAYRDIRDYDATAREELPAPAARYPRAIDIREKNIPELEYETVFPDASGDFGCIYAGYLGVTVESDRPGELLCDPQEIPGRSMFPERIRYGAGTTRWEGFRLHSLRYLALSGGAGARVTVRLSRPVYPAPRAGYFRCSDETLNRVHADSAAALGLCRNTCHLDSPIHQEALGCTGDYYIESMMAYALLGEYALSRLDLLRTAWYLEKRGGRMFHTAYTLIWVRWLREHYRYTGDAELLRAARPALEAVLGRFSGYERAGWLDCPPDYLFIDWVPVGEFNLHHPPRPLGEGALNAFWYDALGAAAEIFSVFGERAFARALSERAAALKALFERKLWRAEEELYAAGTPDRPGDEGSEWRPVDRSGKEYFGVHANALAVAFGIAEGARARAVVRRICSDRSLIPCQPYFYHFLVKAADAAGLMEECGIPALRALAPTCAGGGLKEVFSGFDCDYSHAWGGTAVYDCATRILGVRPAADGFARYEVCPQLGDLEWAEGIVPAPWGYVKVRVEKRGGRTVCNREEVRREQG